MRNQMKFPRNTKQAKAIIAEVTSDGTIRPTGGKYYRPFFSKLRYDKLSKMPKHKAKKFMSGEIRRQLKNECKGVLQAT